MMDILITIPKTEQANQVKEDAAVSQYKGQVVQFWRIGRKPRHLRLFDRVYFVEHGNITCYHEFIGFTYDPVCEVTGLIWRGLNLLLRCPPTYLTVPVPHPSFRGFRYFDERID